MAANAASLRKKLGELPFQVQAFRAGQWCLVTAHTSAKQADKGMKGIRRCTPGQEHLYRVVEASDPAYLR